MIKAATLYIVIIISLLIAMISVSLLSVAFFYRIENLKKDRFDRLNARLSSGTSVLLSSGYTVYDLTVVKDLYGDHRDSVLLHKMRWGAFELNTLKAFELKDTLQRCFLSANIFADSSVIYLADEDRPLSVSGDTQLIGNAELPKSGLKQSYVDGRPYQGKELIRGEISDSERDVPELDEDKIAFLLDYFKQEGIQFDLKDTVKNSFFNPALVYKMASGTQEVSHMKIKGKVVLICDSVLTIGEEMLLDEVLVFAKGIVVKDGFKGSCQLFARDSIVIGKDCDFRYPSFAGVFKPDSSKMQSKIHLGEGSRFAGILMSYEKKRSDLQTMISLARNSLLKGEVFAMGYIKLESPLTVHGKVYARTFMMQKATTLYENFLIDVMFNRKLLSKYYLSSPLFKRNKVDAQVLKWLY